MAGGWMHPPLPALITMSLITIHYANQPVAYAEFSMGGLVTSHRDDVKILHYNYSSLEVLKCIVL